ncbi:MAG: hypothetical protein SFW67_05820 [Myxococcaceae bacterium]|nr:hypothetical protein [Myxococcaceae bacterium]
MHSDTDELEIPRKVRAFDGARVQRVKPLVDEQGDFSGEHRLVTVVGSREVEVRYLETSGEFQVLEADEARELTRSELKDLAKALLRYQQSVPWDDGEAGKVLLGLNEAIFPTRLDGFSLRSVSDLGRVILVAGTAGGEAVDVVLDAVTGELSLLLSREGRGTKKRAPTTQEAHDLHRVLRPLVEGRAATRKVLLLTVVVEAARRRASH